MVDDTGWDEFSRGPKQALVERPTRTIWRYSIPVEEAFTLELPRGAKILRVANEEGRFWFWAEVQPDQPKTRRKFRAFKTGAEMLMDEELEFLGMAALYIQQELMLYYYEVLS